MSVATEQRGYEKRVARPPLCKASHSTMLRAFIACHRSLGLDVGAQLELTSPIASQAVAITVRVWARKRDGRGDRGGLPGGSSLRWYGLARKTV